MKGESNIDLKSQKDLALIATPWHHYSVSVKVSEGESIHKSILKDSNTGVYGRENSDKNGKKHSS